MARRSVSKATGRPASKCADPADQAALAAAVAVLVADGASPTQAHVNTANAALAAITPVTTHLVLSFDTTEFASMNTLKPALAELLDALRASGFPEA